MMHSRDKGDEQDMQMDGQCKKSLPIYLSCVCMGEQRNVSFLLEGEGREIWREGGREGASYVDEHMIL